MSTSKTSTPTQVASELVLSGPEWFPLGPDKGPDPLRLVLGQLADLGKNEEALVQVVVRPATASTTGAALAVMPSGLPAFGSPGGGAIVRAPARSSPGSAASAGRCASAASSGTESR